jgi:hypothetical protein
MCTDVSQTSRPPTLLYRPVQMHTAKAVQEQEVVVASITLRPCRDPGPTPGYGSETRHSVTSSCSHALVVQGWGKFNNTYTIRLLRVYIQGLSAPTFGVPSSSGAMAGISSLMDIRYFYRTWRPSNCPAQCMRLLRQCRITARLNQFCDSDFLRTGEIEAKLMTCENLARVVARSLRSQ